MFTLPCILSEELIGSACRPPKESLVRLRLPNGASLVDAVFPIALGLGSTLRAGVEIAPLFKTFCKSSFRTASSVSSRTNCRGNRPTVLKRCFFLRVTNIAPPVTMRSKIMAPATVPPIAVAVKPD